MNNVGQQLLSGGLSGFASTIVLQPLDLIKTRVQQRDWKLNPHQAPTVLKLVRDIVATEGATGLWRGTTPSLYRSVPGVAMYMTGLTQSHASVLPKLSNQGNLLAGATTRVGVGFLLNPLSVLKARFESDIHQYQSFSRALVGIVRAGPSELFKGFLPSAMRDAPYAGLFVVCYEGIKRETSTLLAPTDAISSTGVHTFAAAAAGAIATLVTHPFDVIKTKIQVRPEDRYHGLRRTIMTVWKQRGISGFFDGASLRISRKVFSSAIGWAVYEGLLIFFDHNRSQT